MEAGFAGIKAFVALGALHKAKRIAFSSVIFPVSELLAQVEKHLGARVRFTSHSPRTGFTTEESLRGVNTYLDIVSTSQVEAAFHLRGIGTALVKASRHFSEFFGPGVFGGKVYGFPLSGGDRRRGHPGSAPIGAQGGRKTSETEKSKTFNTSASHEAKRHANPQVGWFVTASRSIRQFFAY